MKGEPKRELCLTDESALQVSQRLYATIAKNLLLHETFREIVDIITDWLAVSHGTIWQVDERYKELDLLYTESMASHLDTTPWLEIGEGDHAGIAGRVASFKTPIIYEDYDPENHPDQFRTPYRLINGKAPIRMIAAFPLVSQGSVVGVFELIDAEPVLLPAGVKDLLGSFSQLWGDVIESRRRKEEKNASRALKEIIYEAKRECLALAEQSGSRDLGIRQFGDNIARSICSHFESYLCRIIQCGRVSQRASIMGEHKEPSNVPLSLASFYLEPGNILSLTAGDSRSIRLHDVFDEEELNRRKLLECNPALAMPPTIGQTRERLPILLVPIARGGDIIGFLELLGRRTRSGFNESDERVLEEIIELIGNQVSELNLLQSVLKATGNIKESNPVDKLEENLFAILTSLKDEFGADWLFIMEYRTMLQEEQLVCVACCGRDKEEIPDLALNGIDITCPRSIGINAYAYLAERAYSVRDSSLDAIYRHYELGADAGSEICVPLIISEKGSEQYDILGTVCVSSLQKEAFDYSHLALLWIVAAQLAYLIKVSRLYVQTEDRELQLELDSMRDTAYKMAALYIHDFGDFVSNLNKEFETQAKNRSLSHEIRQLLEKQSEQSKVQVDRVGKIRRLLLSQTKPKTDIVSLRDVFRKAELNVRGMLEGEKSVQLVKSKLSECKVYGDKLQIQMVVENILKNAWQVSYPNRNIYVESGIIDERAFLTIRDEGPGFPQSLLAEGIRQRVESSKRGSGIGLWLSMSLVQLNKGTLEINNNSEGRKGASVTIYLRKARVS